MIIFKQNNQANTYLNNLCVIRWIRTKVINEIEKKKKNPNFISFTQIELTSEMSLKEIYPCK